MKRSPDPDTDSRGLSPKDLTRKQIPVKYLIPPAALALALTGGCKGTGTNDQEIDSTIDAPSYNAPVTLPGLPGHTAGSFSSYKVFQPALADMDDDGDLDLFAGTFIDVATDSQKVIFFRNKGISGGLPSFEKDDDAYGFLPSIEARWYDPNLAPMFIAAADIDGDNYVDLLTIVNQMNDGNRRRMGTYIAQGSSGFSPDTPNLTQENHFGAPALVDLDGDEKVDRIYGHSNQIDAFFNGVRFDKNTGSGDFSNTDDYIVPKSDITNLNQFLYPAFADLDNDGDQDMFVVRFDTAAVSYYENTGTASAANYVKRTGTFGLTPPVGETWYPAFGDLDGDGDQDALVGTSSGKILYVENRDIE